MGKRKMNWPETRRRYQERIRMLPDNLWRNLDGAYLGTFEIYSTVEAMDEDDHMDCFAGVVFRVAVEKGYLPLGITSVRKSRGLYICPTLLDGLPRAEATIVYVGKYSYFSNHEKSPFAPVSTDYVYM